MTGEQRCHAELVRAFACRARPFAFPIVVGVAGLAAGFAAATFKCALITHPVLSASIWNAEIASHEGNHYVIRNINGFWNAKIGAGKTVTNAFGFNGFLEDGDSTALQNVVFKGKV